MACNTMLERYFQDLSRGILKTPQIPKTSIDEPKIISCNRLTSAYHGGQKNRNGQTATVLFYHVFYYCSDETSQMNTSQTYKALYFSTWMDKKHICMRQFLLAVFL
jgi:hypothetical protein